MLGFWLFAALGRLLLLGHLLLQLLAALGPDFGTLLALLIEHLLGSKQLDKRLFGSVTLLPASANDPQVAAVAVAVPRRYGVKKPRDSFAGLQESQSLTPGMHVTLLPQSDEPFDVRAHGLGLGDGGLDAVLKKH